MICQKCNGRGTVGYFHIDHFVDIECDRCNGSGEVKHDWLPNEKCHNCGGCGYVNMTNDEWRRTCSTEEFAEWITELSELCTIRHQCELCDSWCDEKKVMEWLKQPHQ